MARHWYYGQGPWTVQWGATEGLRTFQILQFPFSVQRDRTLIYVIATESCQKNGVWAVFWDFLNICAWQRGNLSGSALKDRVWLLAPSSSLNLCWLRDPMNYFATNGSILTRMLFWSICCNTQKPGAVRLHNYSWTLETTVWPIHLL